MLKDHIQSDLKSAMKSKDSLRVSTIRMLIAAIKQHEIDQQITLDDSQTLSIINKMIKQRQDSLKQYQAANRQDLAQKEQQEITILTTYLPAQLSDEAINKAIESALQSTGANRMQDMGKVMGMLKTQLVGRADMAKVSQRVKDRLTG